MTATIGPVARRENGAPPPDVALSDVRLDQLDFWGLDDDIRDGAFATLRREAPITFHEVPELEGFPTGAGHWALASYEHVHYASRHPETFSSVPRSTALNDTVVELAEFLGSMINLDDPRHQRLRAIVNRAFTPKMLAKIEQSVRDRARRLVDELITGHPDGRADFVAGIAGPLPLQIICDMMGIPEEDEDKIFHWTSVLLGGGDPEVAHDAGEFIQVGTDLAMYGITLAEARRAQPADDLTTNLVRAEVDGERLSSEEIASFFILLSAAGNETTRNAISHGMVALSRYPEQREIWWNDFDAVAGTAVEEIVRWASPIIFMRRNLTRDIELGGVAMKAGDKVSMWYNSANRDERKFVNPWMFDVRRDPNPQLGFGGGGVHFCLGANLARREIRVAFDELRRRVPDIVAVEEPAILKSAFVHGIKRLPVAWSAAEPSEALGSVADDGVSHPPC